MTNDELARAIQTGCEQLAALLREAGRRMDEGGVLELDGPSFLHRQDLEDQTMGLYTIADGSTEAFEQEEAVRFAAQTVAPEPERVGFKAPSYLFWYSYQRRFGIPQHTQKMLRATCTAHGIDQGDCDPATLDRVHTLLRGAPDA